MEDPIEGLAQIRAELDVTAQRLEAAQPAADQRFTGSDSTGAVSVTIDPTGGVHAVDVSRSWQREVGLDNLGPAVLEAVQAAAGARLEAWAGVLDEQDNRPRPAARPAPSFLDTFSHGLDEATQRNLDSTQGRAALRELGTLLEQITQGIDQVSGLVEAHAATTFEGRSKGGHVTVAMRGGGNLADVRFDKRWLVKAHEYNIGRELTEAFRAAAERAGERSVADLIAGTPLGDVQRLAADPLGLARRLHLRED